MRYRDIVHGEPISDTHPHMVALSLHPSKWEEFTKFVDAAPRDFRLLSKLHPEPLGWFIFIGCATEAARDRLNEVWG